MDEVEYWYRFEDFRIAYWDPWGECHSGPSTTALRLRKLRVLRHTPKGVWLETNTFERFVLKEANKKYACSTVEEAAESFKARKNRQIKILQAQKRQAKQALRLLEKTREWPDNRSYIEYDEVKHGKLAVS